MTVVIENKRGLGRTLDLCTQRSLFWLVIGFLLSASATNSFAGGSGLNVLVVVNQTSTNSIELGNYYCEKRQVPRENVLRINWSGSRTTWSSNEFQSVLLTPLLAMLTDTALSNQIDYVV